jgi:hypothetical protein
MGVYIAMITQKRLKEVLEYDPITGIFRWRISLNNRSIVGEEAGDVKADSGYRLIGIDRCRYRAHNLAWLWMKGRWPSRKMDHENTVRSDNRWTNLRLASDQQNSANSRRGKNNTSGYKGVFWSKQRGKWGAKINPDRKQVHLGFYADPRDAHAAYRAAAVKYFGEFARAA